MPCSCLLTINKRTNETNELFEILRNRGYCVRLCDGLGELLCNVSRLCNCMCIINSVSYCARCRTIKINNYGRNNHFGSNVRLGHILLLSRVTMHYLFSTQQPLTVIPFQPERLQQAEELCERLNKMQKEEFWHIAK